MKMRAKIIDLARYNEGKEAAETIRIRDCLPHGTEGLDPSHYDLAGVESRWSLSRLISG